MESSENAKDTAAAPLRPDDPGSGLVRLALMVNTVLERMTAVEPSDGDAGAGAKPA